MISSPLLSTGVPTVLPNWSLVSGHPFLIQSELLWPHRKTSLLSMNQVLCIQRHSSGALAGISLFTHKVSRKWWFGYQAFILGHFQHTHTHTHTHALTHTFSVSIFFLQNNWDDLIRIYSRKWKVKKQSKMSKVLENAKWKGNLPHKYSDCEACTIVSIGL